MRLAAFITLFLFALLTPLPVFLFGALIYALFYDAYELFVIGIIIDSVYGTTLLSLKYTVWIAGLLLFFTVIRPYLSWYATRI